MQNQIFYIYKFKSSRLREFNFDISLTFDEALNNKEVISIFDSHLLKAIRSIKNQKFDYEKLNYLKKKKEKLKRNKHSKENSKNIIKIQSQINEMLFIPEIISIVMETKADYSYLFKKHLKLNGKTYRRFSCSAGQARVSTVLFCESEIADKLDKIFNNGRDLNKKLVPSKYNAYKGLISSSISTVSFPKFCVVPDYKSETEVTVNFVIETDENEDEIIEQKTYNELFNRFDGQGLISPELAEKWANELELDYIPSQWCIRQNYLKGMVNVFDFRDFCEKENNGNYIIKTSYKDENDNPIEVDLRDIDLIISESMFKLWDSWKSVDEYIENCKKNGLEWGVSLVNPKEDKDILRMNYQFLQTLNLNKDSIKRISKKFVDWIEGINSKNIYYTILFLLGEDINEESITKYMNKSENYWVKSLIVNPNLIQDKWIKKKIYELTKNKIKKGCLGQILVDGNFQVIVADPYAQMQHICGQKVTGLLKKGQHYSHYWNKRGVKVVDSMRAPLTYRSEHVLLNLQNTDEMKYWYKYNKSGIIVNVHGDETMRWAGSDFDMDILATTSNKDIIDAVYKNELPISYSPPKSKSINFTEEDLYNADLHSFGSEIGQITNKSTSGYALLAQLEEGTKEYDIILNRIKSCTKFQSAQIDKAKIGRKVKSTPKTWQNFNYIDYKNDSKEEIEKKELLNKLLLDKHPYFFIYLYKNTRQKYRKYYQQQNITCKQLFGTSIDELQKKKKKTTKEHEFLNKFKDNSPVIESDCVMNELCRYIESVDFGIRNIIKQESNSEIYKLLMNGDLSNFNSNLYKKIVKEYETYKNKISSIISINYYDEKRDEFDQVISNTVESEYQILENNLLKVCSDIYELVDYLIYMFYVDKPSYNKEILWKIFGKYIYKNVKKHINSYKIPVPSSNGEIEYLNKKYTLKEVEIID